MYVFQYYCTHILEFICKNKIYYLGCFHFGFLGISRNANFLKLNPRNLQFIFRGFPFKTFDIMVVCGEGARGVRGAIVGPVAVGGDGDSRLRSSSNCMFTNDRKKTRGEMSKEVKVRACNLLLHILSHVARHEAIWPIH